MKTIRFFSKISGVADACPIIPAKEYTAKWMEAAKEDYVRVLKENVGRFEHVYQCPGIFDLFNQGVIVPLWHDVMIKTTDNRSGFQWMIPSNDVVDLMKPVSPIEKHKDGLDRFIPRRHWSLDSAIKFNTPWNVVAPRGVKLLILPVAYPDIVDFESSIGLLDPAVSSEINLQIWWNKINSEVMLKAGTPMAHIIPLSEETFKYEISDMTDHDEKWLKKQNYLRYFTFRTRRNLIKDLYYKHFGK